MPIDVQLPDGRKVTVDTDDPQQAAAAARAMLERESSAQMRPQRDPLNINQDVPMLDRAVLAAAPVVQPMLAGIAGAGRGITAEFQDEIASGVAGAGAGLAASMVGVDPVPIAKEAFLNQQFAGREAQTRLREENPIISGAAEFGGVAAGFGKLEKAGLTAGKAMRNITKEFPSGIKALDRAGIAGANVIDAGLVGGAFAMGRGQTNPLPAAGASALYSLALNPVIGGLARLGVAISPKIPIKVPSVESLKARARQAFNRVDKLGIRYSTRQIDDLASEINSLVPQSGVGAVTSKTHPTVVAALRQLENNRNPSGETITALNQFRSILKSGVPGSKDSQLGNRLSRIVDDFIEDVNPAFNVEDVSPKSVNLAIRNARNFHRRRKNLERLEKRVFFSENRLQTPDQARSSLRTLIENDRSARFFTAEEKKLIQKAVRGTLQQNVSRNIGKATSGTTLRGIISSSAGGGLGAAVTGGSPIGAAIGTTSVLAAGAAAKANANRIAARNLEDVIRIISTGTVKRAVSKGIGKVPASEEARKAAVVALLAVANSSRGDATPEEQALRGMEIIERRKNELGRGINRPIPDFMVNAVGAEGNLGLSAIQTRFGRKRMNRPQTAAFKRIMQEGTSRGLTRAETLRALRQINEKEQ